MTAPEMNHDEALPAGGHDPPMDLLRILDANANRASEGLRVIEDYARFTLDDRLLTSSFKALRHDLVRLLATISREGFLFARETTADVGVRITASDEYQRSDAAQIAGVNQKRVEQALRCLEEYVKPLSPATAAQIESLRYRSYTLARALHITTQSRQQLEGKPLYVLVDAGGSADALCALGRRLAEAGAGVLQLRDKSLDDRELLARARALREAIRNWPTLLIINDRPDLAVLADADGVHVGQEDLPVKEARALVGPRRLIGVSTHSWNQARQAVLDGANYIGCGPTFLSQTKRFSAFAGTDFLRQVSSEVSAPAYAIGGIDLENLDLVLETGISRVAVGAGVTRSGDPAETVRRFLARLACGGATPGRPARAAEENGNEV